MSRIPLGHRLSRELMRRGDRRVFFRPSQYRELRQVDSVEDLAYFLDQNGYRNARASENIDEVADDITIGCNAPGAMDPAKVGAVFPLLGFVLFPFYLLHRLIWGHPVETEDE